MNEEADSVVSDCSEPENILPKKKLKLVKQRLRKYNTNWENDYNWLCIAKSKEFRAYCRLCEEEVSISHGVLNIVKHSKKRLTGRSRVLALQEI